MGKKKPFEMFDSAGGEGLRRLLEGIMVLISGQDFGVGDHCTYLLS